MSVQSNFIKIYLTGDILQASDDLSHVMNSYKKIVEGQAINGETEKAQLTQASARRGKFEQLWLYKLWENRDDSYIFGLIVWLLFFFKFPIKSHVLYKLWLLCVLQNHCS